MQCRRIALIIYLTLKLTGNSSGYSEISHGFKLWFTPRPDPCLSLPCTNGGSCVIDGYTHYNCFCTPAYLGPTCEELKYLQKDNCKYHINFQANSTWSQANQTCRELGGSLAIIENATIQNFLENSTDLLYGTGDLISFWVGGYKRNNKWFWEDFTEIGGDGGFTKWAASRPNNSGNGLIISSMPSMDLRGLRWTSLDWWNENGSSLAGYICEVAVQTICKYDFCQNGGACMEIGCHKHCICREGYGGKNCDTDLLEVTLLSSSSMNVNAGDNVTVKLNITSLDGPVTIRVRNIYRPTPEYDVISAIGETDVQLGRMWQTGRWTTYKFEAFLEKIGTSYKKDVSFHIYVNHINKPSGFTVSPCGTNVTVFYTPSSLSLGIEYKFEILNQALSISTYPESTKQHQVHFHSLSENSLLAVKVTVCPRCRYSPTSSYAFRTTTKEPAQVIRYFLIFKQYDSNICTLMWSVDFPVTQYQLTTTTQDTVASDSSQAIKQTANVSRYQNQRSMAMSVGKNYTFLLSATTCSGIGQDVQGVGQCIIAGVVVSNSTVEPVHQSEGDGAASIALGVVFGLSLLAIVVLVSIYCWRQRQTQAADDNDGTTANKKGTQSKPYQTAYFENNAMNQSDYNSDTSGKTPGYAVKTQTQCVYENRLDKTYENGTVTHAPKYENTALSSQPKEQASASKVYEVPINLTNDGYITPNIPATDLVKDSVYQYENFSKSALSTAAEFPGYDSTDSFTNQNSDNPINTATGLHSAATATAGMKNLTSPLKFLQQTGKPQASRKQVIALKPLTSSKPVISRPDQEQIQVKLPLKPALGLAAAAASKAQRKQQISKVPLKPPKTMQLGNKFDKGSNTQEQSDVAAALGRLKPVGAKK